MKHISAKYGYLQDAITNQDVWLRKEVGTKNNVADGLTKTVSESTRVRNMLTTLKIELLETSKEQLSFKLIVFRCRPWCQSKYWKQEHGDGWPRKLAQEDRDGWPRKLAQEDRDGWPRKLAQEDRDGYPRTVSKFDAGSPWRQSKHWAHEHTDGLFGKLKRERAEPRDGLPGKIETVVTDEKIEKVVTHEQKEVEKIVKSSRRVDGVLWKHRSFSRQFFV